MDNTLTLLVGVLAVLVAISILFEFARKIGAPYPALFVLGGLALALIPNVPRVELDPDLVLLFFLPPLLFVAAVETPIRELRTYIAPIIRLAFGLVLVTIVVVAVLAQLALPQLGLAAALTLGAIVAPTDALAATSVFKRLGAPRLVNTLVDGEALLNDATALVAYRAGVLAVVSGTFVLAVALGGFILAAVGGVLIGLAVGWGASWLLRRIDDAPVEVAISLVVPFVAYLPADQLGLSGVLAAVACGLFVGGRLSRILSAQSRVLFLSTWKMIGFVLNGFVFVLIGVELPDIIAGLGNHSAIDVIAIVVLVPVGVIVTRFIWVFASSMLPNSPRRLVARTNARLARRLTFVVAWAGLRGAVSLAAALALPATFPERSLIVLATFAVIVVTLVGQGLTLPWVLRWAGWDGNELDGDEPTIARRAAYEAGLAAVERARPEWPTHQPLLDRLASGLQDRTQHLGTENPAETAERRQERIEHEQIQLGIIGAQRAAVIELRDSGVINDATLRTVERELDLEELRMEG